MYFRKAFFFFSILCGSVGTFAQSNETATVKGQVKDLSGLPVPFASVSTNVPGLGVMADENGKYELRNLKPGEYTLSATMMGYKTASKNITITGADTLTLNFVLKEEVAQLETVILKGKTRAQKLREEAYAVQVVEAEQFKNTSTDVNQILNKVSGINIRQSGGLGSDFSMSLNGLSGNQVRTFINGVPMDYFGSSLSMNNFSANLISGVEVYKGVVPIHLSSDALGGAVNITTDTRPVDYLDASYSFGSFNTHRVAINGQYYHDSTGFTLRAKSFYNYSDNNYKIDVNLWDYDSGNLADETTEVRRFHDGYKSAMLWLEGGFTNRKWADEFMIGAMRAINEKEVQQPERAIGTASIPLGEVRNNEDKWIFNLSYKKRNLLKDRLSVGSYLVFVSGNQSTVDTSSYRYDWLGGKTKRPGTTKGEVERRTLFNLQRTNLLGNINADYEFVKNHSIAANFSLNSTTFEGSDKLHAEKNTQFRDPSTVNKNIIALAYTGNLWNKFRTTLFTKRYLYNIESVITDYSGEERTPFKNNMNYWGYGLASTYFLVENFQVKASFEHAIRFPESEEIFGNGLNITPNLLLQPEKSNNYNLGFRYSLRKRLNSKFILDVNAFFRDSEDFIRAEPKGIQASYENQASVQSKGIDLNLQYGYKERIRFSGNFTYQDLRNSGKYVKNKENAQPDPFYGDRIPNKPFLFGGFSVSYSFNGLIRKGDVFSIASLHNYTHWFYLKWPSLGSVNKAVIPSQYTTDLEFTYRTKVSRYNASFVITNLLNSKVYDNYKQQRPGRAYSVKIRYFISSNSN